MVLILLLCESVLSSLLRMTNLGNYTQFAIIRAYLTPQSGSKSKSKTPNRLYCWYIGIEPRIRAFAHEDVLVLNADMLVRDRLVTVGL
jgi:hypothetical protein